LARSAFDDDPHGRDIPFTRISADAIVTLVDKLGGDRDTALFGAYRDQLGEDVPPVPEYPADETDKG
jgi:hypothetical protein